MPDWKAAAKLVRTIAENYKLPYYTMSPIYSICKEHGYLVGEHFTCPVCGQEAEVYSRITGYYRPVKNWNAGKTQEYKNRISYDVANSALKKGEKAVARIVAAVEKKREEQPAGTYLFTTKTCPNCKIAKEFLKDMEYQAVDAEENPELAQEFGVMQAPTLVVVKDGNIRKFVNASNIKKFAEEKVFDKIL